MMARDIDDWQYRLSPQTQPGAIPVGRFWLTLGPGLTAFPLIDAAGIARGVILGFPIDLRGRHVIDGPWQVPFTPGADIDRFALDVLWSLGGRFLLILDCNGQSRIYPDCSAQVPCVWDAEAGLVGSTAHALYDDPTYEARLDRKLLADLGVVGEGWLPGGLTAHRGLARLLPGHRLDLDDLTPRRFWPLGAIPVTEDTDAVVDETVALVQAQLQAVIDSPKRLGLALTAGHETRLLLACARPFIGRFDTITVVGQDRHTIDTATARRIGRDMGLNHVELPRRDSTPAQYERFVRRGGHCNADGNSRFHPSVWPIAATHTFLGGLGGEVGRAFLWRSTDGPDTPMSVDTLTNRFGLPKLPVVTEALTRWYKALPPLDTYGILDLAYLENRMGPWYAVQFCSDPTLVRMAPLFTYRGVELMLSLPPEWKRDSRLGHEIIRRHWPELLRYPFNSLGRWRDTLVKLQKVARNPRIVMKKLRKLRT
ncbi:MAG: hypothetical protein JSS08_07425 [Proteobacteria bacterium]|nr:hypothetical protein [Pseudomonadota bacterium]